MKVFSAAPAASGRGPAHAASAQPEVLGGEHASARATALPGAPVRRRRRDDLPSADHEPEDLRALGVFVEGLDLLASLPRGAAVVRTSPDEAGRQRNA